MKVLYNVLYKYKNDIGAAIKEQKSTNYILKILLAFSVIHESGRIQTSRQEGALKSCLR